MGKGITVTGRGRATGPHDECSITVGAEVRAGTAAEALAQCSEALNVMRATVLAAGVAESSLSTSAVSLNPVYADYPTVAGFSAAVSLTATTRSLSGVGPLLAAVVSAGGDAARLHEVSYRHADPGGLAVAAREAAWEDALARATQLAELSGRTLGEVVSVAEAQDVGQPGLLRSAKLEAFDAGAPVVDAGVSDVSVALTVRWALR